jgi:hypothetical protein
VYTPVKRISRVLARHGYDQGRSPSWIKDADARQIASVNEAIAALRLK